MLPLLLLLLPQSLLLLLLLLAVYCVALCRYPLPCTLVEFLACCCLLCNRRWQERFEALVPRFERYCATLSDFKKNQLNRLSPDLTQEVRRRWAPSFKQFGYT